MYYARKAEPRSSKLLYERELAERHKRHKDRLRRMKPSVDNKPPKRFVHLERNLKKEQMQEGETVPSPPPSSRGSTRGPAAAAGCCGSRHETSLRPSPNRPSPRGRKIALPRPARAPSAGQCLESVGSRPGALLRRPVG